MNEARNEGGSVTVGLPEMRRNLIAQRERYGADTAIGHRITNLIGQTDFLPAAFGEHRKILEALIVKGTAELADLTRDNQ